MSAGWSPSRLPGHRQEGLITSLSNAGDVSRKYGFFALALYLLATSKWGSYFPFTVPPYISDLVIAFVGARWVLFKQKSQAKKRGKGTPLKPLAAILVLWSIIEFLRGSYSVVAARDAAPYLYAIGIFMVAPLLAGERKRMGRYIDGAIIFHLAWVGLALAAPTIVQHLPTIGQIGLFVPRNDFDGAVCGLFAAYAFHRALCGNSIAINVSLGAANAVCTFALKERAGLLALAVGLVVVVALLRRERVRSSRAARAKALIPVFLMLLPLVGLTVNNVDAYQRLLAAVHTYVPFVHANAKNAQDTGTETARSKAWSRIASWEEQSAERYTVGVGFGPDFMHESGADVLLLGGANPDVRSPHNYYVGTWARLGAIGLVLVSAITLCGVWLAVLARRYLSDLGDVDVLAILVVFCIPVAAAVGVILESPFGAVPWFWALGHLGVRVQEARSVNSAGRSVMEHSKVSL